MNPYSLPFIAPTQLGTSAWLLRLRWFAVFGQLVTVVVAVGVAGVHIPWMPLLGLITVTAVTNASYGVWLRQAKKPKPPGQSPPIEVAEADKIATTLMMVDIVTLTAMLYLSGGIDNPFSLFYFVNLAVGGVILRPRWAWVLTAMAIAGSGLLIVDSLPIEGFMRREFQAGSALYFLGLFVAYATCSCVVTHFVTRTAAELTRSERQLSETQTRHAQALRLEGLTTLAAGAAHELATPLSTIDVIARELERHLQGCEIPASVREDLRLIDHQLEMCKQILRRMRGAAGDSMINQWNHTTVGELIDCALEGVRDPERVDVTDGPVDVETQPLWLPQEAMAQAIRNLIHNGLDASGTKGRVMIDTRISESKLEVRIRDSGRGMSEEELGRAGEPFFTTKEPGRGMGLGLFLTRSVVSRLGGKLNFQSVPGVGTEAIVILPCPPTQQTTIQLQQ
jgi:two-component system sensor histidine kinase RegB